MCHLDASKGMVAWARENAALNDLTQAPIRSIVDDATKFLTREIKRGVHSDAIVWILRHLDVVPKASFSKLRLDLMRMLDQCRGLLSEKPLFLFLSYAIPRDFLLLLSKTSSNR